MTKIYTKVVTDWDGNILEEESYDYDGPLALGKDDGDSESTQQAIPWEGVQPFLSSGYQEANNLYGTQGYPGFFPDQTYVDRNPLENAGQGMSLDYAMNQMPGQIFDAQKAQFEMLNAPDVANNPYVQGIIDVGQNRMNENLTQNTLPAIRGGALSHGAVGGSKQGIAEGLALQGNQRELADFQNQVLGQAYGQGLEAQYRGALLAPQTMQMGMLPYQQMSQAGEYARGTDEMALQEAMARYNYEQQAPFASIQDALGLYAGTPWGSMMQSDGGGSGAAGAAGGALAGAAAGSAIMPGWGTAIGAGVGLLGSGIF